MRELGMGGTASGAVLRQHYERTLRCFELYCRAGACATDAAAGVLPPRDRIQTQAQQREHWAARGAAPQFATFLAYPALLTGGDKSTQSGAVNTRPAGLKPGIADTQHTDSAVPVSGPDAVGRPVWRKWEGHGWYEVRAHRPVMRWLRLELQFVHHELVSETISWRC
jgi:hypothetical protein